MATAVLVGCRRETAGTRAPAGDAAFDAAPPGGYQEVLLVRKDRGYHEIPYRRGDARGRFWYRVGPTALAWRVQASGLQSGGSYWLMFRVDQVDYAVASLRANAQGGIGGADSLSQFADRVCQGESQPQTPLAGRHRLQVWLSRPPDFAHSEPLAPNSNVNSCAGGEPVLFEHQAIDLAFMM